ncbi:MAG TPA: hypothetical protein VFE33_17000 [Thermoanaerobaculia bacterium]|nr:hypothetical protein [Thermoanaerobaculia bacterium]
MAAGSPQATIYETGETEGGRAFLALAFYEGESLQQKLEQGPLPLHEALGIARQIAWGLAAAVLAQTKKRPASSGRTAARARVARHRLGSQAVSAAPARAEHLPPSAVVRARSPYASPPPSRR